MASDTGLKTRLKGLAIRGNPKFFPWKIFYRFVVVQSALVLVALGVSALAARYFFKSQFLNQVRSQLRDSLTHISQEMTSPPGKNWCSGHARGEEFQITLIRLDGSVLCDARGSSFTDNQNGQQEFIGALSGPFGQNIRYDSRMKEMLFYGAVRATPYDVVVRAAVPLTRLSQTMSVFDGALFVALIVISAALLLLAFWSAKRLVFPLGRLLLKTQAGALVDPPSREDFTQESYDEWLEIESNIDNIRKDLAAKTQSLSMEQVELDTIMGAISDAILAVDPDGNPLFFNSRFELLFGGEGLRKRNIKLWGIFRDPEILGAFTSALREGKVAATKAIPLEQKAGLRSFFALSVSPLRKQDGVIYGAVGIFHDVTQLKSAEQMRIDFVANVSHELRTPLTSIKGYVDTLIGDVGQGRPTDKEFLEIILRNSERLLNLMNDLLDLSSIESEDDIIQKDPLDTKDLTERMTDQFKIASEAKQQKISSQVEATEVFADPQRLEQILTNLLDNACKYTPNGGDIKVSWLSDGNDVLLKVANTGPGVPIEHHPRLFERFYRVDKARSREQGGTGLGLAIVKHIMQKHEGSVWVESKPGQGATFICRFPSRH